MQVFSLRKDKPKKYSGVRISANSSPRVLISRRYYQDDFDDTDCSCPFDVDCDDMKDPGSRYLLLKFAGIMLFFSFSRQSCIQV